MVELVISTPFQAAFKFDVTGDWSVNYGDFDNTRGFNPHVNAMEGHLDPDGSNIEVACGKTCYVYISYYGSSSSNTYGLRELAARVPQSLPADKNATFRKAERIPQFYGSIAIAEQATPYQALPNGLTLWRFAVSCSIDGIDSIVFKNNNNHAAVEIDPALIQ